MAGRTRSLLVKAGLVAAVLLALSVVAFDLVFVWFGPPADERLAAVWFGYLFLGNVGFLIGGAYAAGYLRPVRLHRRSKARSP